MENRSRRAYSGWAVALAIVLVYALVPVLWLISLSFKSPATVSDKKFIPTDTTF